jgi:hypothetical protein
MASPSKLWQLYCRKDLWSDQFEHFADYVRSLPEYEQNELHTDERRWQLEDANERAVDHALTQAVAEMNGPKVEVLTAGMWLKNAWDFCKTSEHCFTFAIAFPGMCNTLAYNSWWWFVPLLLFWVVRPFALTSAYIGTGMLWLAANGFAQLGDAAARSSGNIPGGHYLPFSDAFVVGGPCGLFVFLPFSIQVTLGATLALFVLSQRNKAN